MELSSAHTELSSEIVKYGNLWKLLETHRNLIVFLEQLISTSFCEFQLISRQ